MSSFDSSDWRRAHRKTVKLHVTIQALLELVLEDELLDTKSEAAFEGLLALLRERAEYFSRVAHAREKKS